MSNSKSIAGELRRYTNSTEKLLSVQSNVRTKNDVIKSVSPGLVSLRSSDDQKQLLRDQIHDRPTITDHDLVSLC